MTWDFAIARHCEAAYRCFFVGSQWKAHQRHRSVHLIGVRPSIGDPTAVRSFLTATYGEIVQDGLAHRSLGVMMSDVWARRFEWVWVVAVSLAFTQLASLYIFAHRLAAEEARVWKSALVLVAVVVIVSTRHLVRSRQAPGDRPHYGRITTITATLAAAVVVGVVGMPFVVVAVAAFGPGSTAPPVGPGVDALSLGAALASTAIFAPIVEEVLFRVVLLGLLARVMPVRAAVVVQALVFAVAHTTMATALARSTGFEVTGTAHNVSAAVAVAFAGLLYGYLTIELQSIWPAIAVHSYGNAFIELRSSFPWTAYPATALLCVCTGVAAVRGLCGLADHFRPLTGNESRLVRWIYPYLVRCSTQRSPELRRLHEWSTPLLPHRWHFL